MTFSQTKHQNRLNKTKQNVLNKMSSINSQLEYQNDYLYQKNNVSKTRPAAVFNCHQYEKNLWNLNNRGSVTMKKYLFT